MDIRSSTNEQAQFAPADDVAAAAAAATAHPTRLKRRFSRTTSTSIRMENESDTGSWTSEVGQSVTSTTTTAASSTMQPTPPALPLTSQSPLPVRLKASDRRSRCFQRALSCDVTSMADVARVAKPSTGSMELEMTFVEKDRGSVSSDGKMGSPKSPMSGGNLTAANKGTGIVCSDEDLRLILTEVAECRRVSAETKREKMKSNRSLSLDSSFFKSHLKRLQADSPGWLARILNQKEPSKSNSSSGGGEGITSGFFFSNDSLTATTAQQLQPLQPSSPAQISDDAAGAAQQQQQQLQRCGKRNSTCKKPEMAPETIVEDAQSSESDDRSSSRRESNVSNGSDDERSLLLNCSSSSSSNNSNDVANNNNNNNDNNCVVVVSCNDSSQVTMASVASSATAIAPSKVVWTEGSLVDAELLGTAIEFYLTSVNAKKPVEAVDGCSKCGRPSGTVVGVGAASVGDNGGPSTSGLPVVSTLKGLFVK